MTLLPLGLRLLLQEVRRSPGRILLLSAAVAIGSASIFLSLVFRQTIQSGLENSLNRLGADGLILPKGVTHKLTAARLTGEPGSPALDPGILPVLREIPGIETIAPQRSFTVESDEGHGETELVAFDPQNDITVLPWVSFFGTVNNNLQAKSEGLGYPLPRHTLKLHGTRHSP